MDVPLGVGIIGAGPGVAALHLPTLARRAEAFRVVRIADGGSGRAARLAERIGADSSHDWRDVVADPSVDVVAICSPPDAHEEQVVTAAEAGARAIFCEKPLAASREGIERAIDACRRRGTALVIGTNHLHDPAWGRAMHHHLEREAPVRGITVTLALPPNSRYHRAVTDDPPTSPSAGRPAPDWTNREAAAAIVRQLVLGLAVHDLPLVRDLAPGFERVVFAREVPPIGCSVGFIASGIPVSLAAVMLPGGADALWRVRIATATDEVDVDFPPSFVHRGSAVVTVRDAAGRVVTHPADDDDGYIAEWRALETLVAGWADTEYDEIAADARYALDIADAAADWIRREAS
ncbi:MAG: Gfo/Idh/MocA family protein [Microbacterium gubbeenense]|uniref:Gfo/Idh/MocA family protein n=1 Tax=Microbacterium gubbeenense TaxID=159896 RepID=UPI003F9769AC